MEQRMKKNKKIYLASAALAVIAFLVYLPSLGNGFVNWDDQTYVINNPYIRSLDLAFIKWALTNIYFTNWHPLTIISYAVDYAIWGTNPFGYHLTNNILHGLNTALAAIFAYLFFAAAGEPESGKVKRYSMGALFAAVVTALLFGLHPLRVESVAWVSERKDVLCGFFYLLSMIFYMRYAAPPRNGWALNYAASLGCFFLALTAKPMAITLPAVLLVLDLYPLERLKPGRLKKTLAEKAPFFALGALAAALAVWAQRVEGALAGLDPYPLTDRLLVSSRAAAFYIYKTALPFSLAPFYPREAHPSLLSFGHLAAVVLILLITIACVATFRKKKIFSAMWLFYLITLAPVIGIVQVGSQAAADRYTYLPSLPLALLVGAGAGYLFTRKNRAAKALPMAVVVISALLSLLTLKQAHIWKDSISLWSHEVRVYPDQAPIGQTNLGIAYKDLGDYRTAIEWYNRALVVDPLYADAYTNRGVAYSSMGMHAEAIRDFTAALKLRPQNPEALSNRGASVMSMGEYDRAIEDFTAAIGYSGEKNPMSAGTFYNRGIAYKSIGRYAEALKDFGAAIGFNPDFAGAYNNRGGVYLRTGRYDLAERDYLTAIRLNESSAVSYYNLALVYIKTGERDKAVESLKKAASLGLPQAEQYLKQMGE